MGKRRRKGWMCTMNFCLRQLGTLEFWETLLDSFGNLGPIAPIMLAMVESFFPPLPLIAIVALNVAAHGGILGFLYSWAGVALGGSIMFLFWRRVVKCFFWKFASRSPKLEKAQQWVNRFDTSSLFMLALYGMSAVYLRKSGVALKNMLFLPVVGCMLSASFFFTDNTTAKLLVFCFDVLIYALWLLYASGNAADPDFDTLWYDSLKALFVMPFSSLYAIFFAMCRNKNGKSRAKLALWVFLGVLLAVIPTVIVTGLLISADGGFGALVGKLGDRLPETVSDVFVRLFFCVSLSALTFGSLRSNVLRLYPRSLCRESIELHRERRAAAARLKGKAVLKIGRLRDDLGAVFGHHQLAHVLRHAHDIADDLLPSGVDNYAEFARRGFFELCAVSVINAVVMLCVSSFAKRNGGEKPLGARIYCVVYAVASLCFTGIAISKMLLYITKFGLTRLRVYTTVFIVMLAVLFVLAVIRQLVGSFPFMKCAVVTVSLFSLLFAFGRFDGFIADYNVSAYLDGRLESVDTDALAELSCDAYPAVRRLADEAADPVVAKNAMAVRKAFELKAKTRRSCDANISVIQIKGE